MTWIWRSLCAIGALLIVGAVALAAWQRGMEYASWVAAAIGALSLAGGLLTRALTPAPDPAPEDSSGSGTRASGDEIDQTKIRTKGNVIGKQSRGTGPGGDRIRQRDIHSNEGDVIGKQDRE